MNVNPRDTSYLEYFPIGSMYGLFTNIYQKLPLKSANCR